MNFLSSFRSPALGTTLDGGNMRRLGPLRLHGRHEALLSQWQLRLKEAFTWLNHILTLHIGETSHQTTRCRRSGGARRKLCSLLQPIPHSLWHWRRAGVLSKQSSKGFSPRLSLNTANRSHKPHMQETSTVNTLPAILQAAWRGELHHVKLHCCKTQVYLAHPQPTWGATRNILRSYSPSLFNKTFPPSIPKSNLNT